MTRDRLRAETAAVGEHLRAEAVDYKRRAGRPPKPAGEKLTEQIHVLCTLDDRRAIEARAEARGVSVSQYMREAALGRSEKQE